MQKPEILELLPYAKNQGQIDFLNAYAETGSYRKAGEVLGIAHNNLYRKLESIKKWAALRGFSPENDMVHVVPDGFKVKGVSTYYGADGQPRGQWVKSTEDRERREEMIREVLEALKEDIPKESPVLEPSVTEGDLLNLYVITDYHFGMYAWGEETGADWDMDIAEDTLVKWFTKSLAMSPNSEIGVLANLGDFAHWDGINAVTPTSGHVLDADTRFRLLVRVMIRVIRRVIQMMLQKHKTVKVLMAEGNHDIASSAWLSEMFNVLYEDEPRVEVDTNPDPYYCIEHGNTSLFFHHGHKKRFPQLETVFIAKYREVFGRTKHSYAHTGHLHHEKVQETNTMILKQHRTLAAPDSHASRGGWMSGRSAVVETYSKEYGRVMINEINFDMLKK